MSIAKRVYSLFVPKQESVPNSAPAVALALVPTMEAEPAPEAPSEAVMETALEPALTPRIRASDHPVEIAKDHARRFFVWLIETRPRADGTFTFKEVEQLYREWCVQQQVHPRGWNKVGEHFNNLLAPDAGPRKPTEPYVDSANKSKKRRCYVIPRREPSDWQERLGYRAALGKKAPSAKTR